MCVCVCVCMCTCACVCARACVRACMELVLSLLFFFIPSIFRRLHMIAIRKNQIKKIEYDPGCR